MEESRWGTVSGGDGSRTPLTSTRGGGGEVGKGGGGGVAMWSREVRVIVGHVCVKGLIKGVPVRDVIRSSHRPLVLRFSSLGRASRLVEAKPLQITSSSSSSNGMIRLMMHRSSEMPTYTIRVS